MKCPHCGKGVYGTVFVLFITEVMAKVTRICGVFDTEEDAKMHCQSNGYWHMWIKPVAMNHLYDAGGTR